MLNPLVRMFPLLHALPLKLGEHRSGHAGGLPSGHAHLRPLVSMLMRTTAIVVGRTLGSAFGPSVQGTWAPDAYGRGGAAAGHRHQRGRGSSTVSSVLVAVVVMGTSWEGNLPGSRIPRGAQGRWGRTRRRGTVIETSSNSANV